MVATLVIVVSQPATPAKMFGKSLPSGSLMTHDRDVQPEKRMMITRTERLAGVESSQPN